jgi:hypothetical protein
LSASIATFALNALLWLFRFMGYHLSWQVGWVERSETHLLQFVRNSIPYRVLAHANFYEKSREPRNDEK